MSRWKTSFESLEALKRIEESLRALESVKADGLPPEELAEYARLLKVVKILAARFATLDPELYPQNLFGNFGSWSSAVQALVGGYQKNRGLDYLQNANANADEILRLLPPFDAGVAVENIKAITEANTALHRKIVIELKTRADQVKGDLDALSKAIALAKSRLVENNNTIE